MKTLTDYTTLIASTLVCFSMQILADQPRPRPVFMPSTPPAAKAITVYSTADVVGAVITDSSQIPSDHGYSEGKYKEGLKSTWPGATDTTRIDAMVQIVLDAPATSGDNEISDSFNNIRYVIQKIMDVPDKDKADAFVRIVVAQTDPLKTKRAKKFARKMFEELLDVRLLAYEKEALDDATEYTEPYKRAETKPRRKSSIRVDAKRSLLWTLNHTLEMGIDETPFKTADEGANCAALKTWLTTNWTQITDKCAQVKAVPNRVKPKVNIQVWDARW